MSSILQQILNGLTQGCTYSLIAIGYAMIFGALRKMNWSHSDVFAAGSMCTYFFLGLLIPNCHNLFILLLVGLLCGALSSAAVGWGIEKIAFRKLRFVGSSSMANSLCTIGCGFVLKEVGRLIFGAQNQRFGNSYDWLKVYTIPGVNITITNYQIIMMLIAVALIIVLQLFLFKTNTGRAIRAMSMNFPAAQLMGINLDRISSLTFMISSAISGMAGVLVGFYYRTCSPYMGALPGTKAFAAIVMGGLTSIPGAFAGGLLLGVFENIGGMLMGEKWRDGVAYFIFFLVLIVRPQGLFGGEKVEERA